MTASRRSRPLHPKDLFPNGDWRSWRAHVLTVDIEAVHAAVIAERLERFFEAESQRGRTMRDIAMTTGIGKSSLSTMSRCMNYSMEGMLARIQAIYAVDLDPVAEVRLAKIDALERKIAELEQARADSEAYARSLEAILARSTPSRAGQQPRTQPRALAG